MVVVIIILTTLKNYLKIHRQKTEREGTQYDGITGTFLCPYLLFLLSKFLLISMYPTKNQLLDQCCRSGSWKMRATMPREGVCGYQIT